MIINTNMASLNTIRQLSINQKATQNSLAKLSSGLRINSAADDAAGLAISEKMRGQISGLNQAQRNAQDGISLVSTAEGALNETTSILQRMRELAVQATNDSATNDDRSQIQKEASALVDEIDRIGNTTEFNTMKLINGNVALTKTSDNVNITAYDVATQTKSGVYAANITTAATQAITKGTGTFNGANLTTTSSMTINNVSVSFTTGDTQASAVAKINNVSTASGVEAFVNDKGDISLRTTAYGSAAKITTTFSDAATQTALGFATSTVTAGTDAAGTINGVTATGTGKNLALNATGNAADGLVVQQTGTSAAATVVGDTFVAPVASDVLKINGTTVLTATGGETIDAVTTAINAATSKTGVTATNDGTKITLTTVAKGDGVAIDTTGTTDSKMLGTLASNVTTAGSDGIAIANGNITVNSANTLSFHVGANSGQTMGVDINDMRSTAIGKNVANNSNITSIEDLKTLNAFESKNSAEDAINVIDQATKDVSGERAKLGAVQNRLEHTINNLGTSSQNVTAAEANIRDVDMAAEMTNFQKNNILQQAAQAMLAQANQQPQGVLQLLR